MYHLQTQSERSRLRLKIADYLELISENKGQVKELKTIMEFYKFLFDNNTDKDIPAVVLFHNDCPEIEEEFDFMQSQFIQIAFAKVNADFRHQIVEEYADSAAIKPYFKFFKNNQETDHIKYDKWTKQEPKLRRLLEEYYVNK